MLATQSNVIQHDHRTSPSVSAPLASTSVTMPRAIGSSGWTFPRIVQKHQAEEILIAIPSANKGILAKILQDCRDTGIPTQILSRTKKLASAASA